MQSGLYIKRLNWIKKTSTADRKRTEILRGEVNWGGLEPSLKIFNKLSVLPVKSWLFGLDFIGLRGFIYDIIGTKGKTG